MELVLGRARPTLDGNCCCLPLRAHLSVAIRQTPLLVRSSQKQCPQQIYIEFFSILSMRDEMYRGGMSERRRELPMSLMSFELGASSIAFALARGVKRIVGKWRGQDLRRRLLSSIGHAIGRAKGKKDSRLSGEPDLDAPAPEVPRPPPPWSPTSPTSRAVSVPSRSGARWRRARAP